MLTYTTTTISVKATPNLCICRIRRDPNTKPDQGPASSRRRSVKVRDTTRLRKDSP